MIRESVVGRCQKPHGKRVNIRGETSVLVGPVVGLPAREHTNTSAACRSRSRLGRQEAPRLRDGYPGPVTKDISTVTRASEMTADLPRVLWER